MQYAYCGYLPSTYVVYKHLCGQILAFNFLFSNISNINMKFASATYLNTVMNSKQTCY